MLITPEALRRIIDPCPGRYLNLVAPVLPVTMARYAVETPARVCHFLAQVLHESGRLGYLCEAWGPTPAQRRYEPPGRLARSLGNTEPGDGHRFRGRGLIQLTGRANYQRYSAHLKRNGEALDLVAQPDLLLKAPQVVDVAGWYWASRGLNGLADRGFETETLKKITRRINGGLNGLADRQALLNKCAEVLWPVPAREV